MGNKTIEQKPVSYYKILCSYGSNQKELNLLIETCVKLSLQHLKLIYSRVHKLLTHQDLSLEDLAIDSIVRLFVQTSKDGRTSIQASFENWQPKILNEEDTLFFLNKVVSNRVNQHISDLLREADPFFSKILSSVEYLIKLNQYRKINHFGKVYIIESMQDNISDLVISDEEFDLLPGSLFGNNKTLLNKLVKYLANETDYFPAIPLNALVYKLKNINAQSFLISSATESPLSKIEISELVNKSLKISLNKLESGYLKKGKLNNEETELFRKALTDMAQDLKDGGVNPGLYKYFAPYSDGLTKKEYQSKYHNTLEYLLKLMKNKIGEMIDEGNN